MFSPKSLFLVVLACSVAVAPAFAAETSGDYRLVWSDEFNQDGPLDPNEWSFEQGFVRNQELQWYQPENAVRKGGFLIIEARKERRPNPRYVAGSTAWQTSREFIEYTSTSATTRGKHSWTYGRFELRARIDTRAGSWPAFWTLGTQGRWPANGEIDIMEFYRGILLFNIAWARGDNGRAVWNDLRKLLAEFPADWSSKFHVWRMDWDETSIKLYLDDVLMNSQDISQPLRDAAPRPNPFHGPVYLLINQAIGGTEGGDPSNTEFPVRYEIDYVRVYQKPVHAPAVPPALAGKWEGVVQGANLSVAFHFDARGQSTFDSPTVNLRGVPGKLTVKGNEVVFAAPSIHLTFEGTLDGRQIEGNYTLKGEVLPLLVTKAEK